MSNTRNIIFGLVAGLGMINMTGCDDICGPCGTIATGNLSIAGQARIDGFFKAVADFKGSVDFVKADFDANIIALAEVWGVVEVGYSGAVDADLVAALKAEIQGQISANLQGGIQVVYAPPKCTANINVAVEAQASCEASAECDVMVDPGSVSVMCEGSCSGGCSAECSGEFSCEVEAPSIACEGMCEGACTLDAAASCEGTCRGTCSGECSARDGNGDCAGACDGMCTGTCEFEAAASCQGTCSGKCLVDQGSAQCTAEANCRGSCSGECSGGCEGSATPPSASASCEASADCQAQASAQAEANVECTPPSLDIQYSFSAGVNAEAQALFAARIKELKVRGAAILQGSARLQALITGEVNGQVIFEVAPLVKLQAEIKGFIDGGIDILGEVPKGRINCVIPAFIEAGEALASAGGSVTGTIEAQASFATILF